MNQPVLVETISTHSGHNLGVLTLNEPKTLNALSLDMCILLSQTLSQWQTDSSIVAVLLKSNSDKAFCAGGNIRKLYDSMVNQSSVSKQPSINPDAEAFFSNEYRLYHQMYRYTKPIILWANGIVMGGGMGLMAMSSHRVVTNTTRFAMPEINIGLYPDATGSWFLQRMPASTGLFLGLTGAHGNAADAILSNMAEYALSSDELNVLITALTHANWNDADAKNNADNPISLHHIASQALSNIHHTQHLADSNLTKHWQLINTITNKGDIHAIDAELQNPNLAKQYAEDSWLMHAIQTYQYGCPVTAALTFEAFKRAKGLSLQQVLYMELNLSLNCVNNPDFREGIRALLVDKDRKPTWSKSLSECTQSYIDAHFISPYINTNKTHPFAD